MIRSSDVFEAHQRARFMRPDAARWMRPDAARWLKPQHPGELKYSPDQPRDERGRWTDGGGGSSASQSREFSSDRSGWHDYHGENLVCRADLRCSADEIADHLARFSVPGRYPSIPVMSDTIYKVFIPGTDIYVGDIRTTITDDGLTIINRTQPGHIFFDGEVERRATQAIDGAWYVTTRGIGNNVEPGMNVVNQIFGPGIFNGLDQQMRANIELHHGRKGFLVWALDSGAAVAAGRRPGTGHVVVGAKAHV
jgi:hypothetical protein